MRRALCIDGEAAESREGDDVPLLFQNSIGADFWQNWRNFWQDLIGLSSSTAMTAGVGEKLIPPTRAEGTRLLSGLLHASAVGSFRNRADARLERKGAIAENVGRAVGVRPTRSRRDESYGRAAEHLRAGRHPAGADGRRVALRLAPLPHATHRRERPVASAGHRRSTNDQAARVRARRSDVPRAARSPRTTMARCPSPGQTRDPASLAPRRIQAFLAMEDEAQGRKTKGFQRDDRPDPHNGRGQSALGSGAHSRRAPEAGHSSREANDPAVHAQRAKAPTARAEVGDISEQPPL